MRLRKEARPSGSFALTLKTRWCPDCGALTALALEGEAQGSVTKGAACVESPVDNQGKHRAWHERNGHVRE